MINGKIMCAYRWSYVLGRKQNNLIGLKHLTVTGLNIDRY